jgi:hypothetical protein
MTTRDERQITEEIHEVRHDLGDTVEALAHKADVPTRVRERAAEVPPRRWALLAGAVAALTALFVTLRMVRSR